MKSKQLQAMPFPSSASSYIYSRGRGLLVAGRPSGPAATKRARRRHDDDTGGVSAGSRAESETGNHSMKSNLLVSATFW
jgi:hypothetical protein